MNKAEKLYSTGVTSCSLMGTKQLRRFSTAGMLDCTSAVAELHHNQGSAMLQSACRGTVGYGNVQMDASKLKALEQDTTEGYELAPVSCNTAGQQEGTVGVSGEQRNVGQRLVNKITSECFSVGSAELGTVVNGFWYCS